MKSKKKKKNEEKVQHFKSAPRYNDIFSNLIENLVLVKE